jgi:hypothetical protein
MDRYYRWSAWPIVSIDSIGIDPSIHRRLCPTMLNTLLQKQNSFPSMKGNGVNCVDVRYFPYRHEIYTQWRGFSLAFLTE